MRLITTKGMQALKVYRVHASELKELRRAEMMAGYIAGASAVLLVHTTQQLMFNAKMSDNDVVSIIVCMVGLVTSLGLRCRTSDRIEKLPVDLIEE